MKKNKEKFIKNQLCESCCHILGELGTEFDENCLNYPAPKLCALCKQEMDLNKSDQEFSYDLDLFQSALSNPLVKVVCFTAPSVRVALGDEFGAKLGENIEGKMVSALKTLGAFKVFDMNTAADFTVVEEAKEFLERLEKNQNLPMFTSCCPGWVNFCTKLYPNLTQNLSTCKSPQQMFGSLINNYFTFKNGLKSTDIFTVSIVPCVAKKTELLHQNLNTNVGQDVDVAITTKELATLLKSKNINPLLLEDQNFDEFFGTSSGAGAIFGNTGGVTEALLRTAHTSLCKEEKQKIEFEMVRGTSAIRKAQIRLGKTNFRVAVVMGLKNLPPILKEIEQNKNAYQLVEVMACEGGCIGGPGQPKVQNQDMLMVLKNRSRSLYDLEKKKAVRVSHQNPALIQIYDEFLGEIGGEKAHKLLHRNYNNQKD